jgi:hypothetical protein
MYIIVPQNKRIERGMVQNAGFTILPCLTGRRLVDSAVPAPAKSALARVSAAAVAVAAVAVVGLTFVVQVELTLDPARA